jgi:transposase
MFIDHWAKYAWPSGLLWLPYDYEIVGDGQRQSRGGRRRQNMTAEQERELLAPFLERASTGGILVVGQVKAEIEARLGRSMALSSVYNLLHRHGWRKLAPDRRHPQSDPLAQQEWKKNSPSGSPKSARSGPAKPRSG